MGVFPETWESPLVKGGAKSGKVWRGGKRGRRRKEMRPAWQVNFIDQDSHWYSSRENTTEADH